MTVVAVAALADGRSVCSHGIFTHGHRRAQTIQVPRTGRRRGHAATRGGRFASQYVVKRLGENVGRVLVAMVVLLVSSAADRRVVLLECRLCLSGQTVDVN